MDDAELARVKDLFNNPSVKLTAILKAASVDAVAKQHHDSLTVEPEESQYKWHADITNWPVLDNKEVQKALHVTIAKELALHVEECVPEP